MTLVDGDVNSYGYSLIYESPTKQQQSQNE